MVIDRRLQQIAATPRIVADMGQKLCFQKARAEEICFRIFNVAVHNRPSRRTNAERGLIQSGFSCKIARASRSSIGPRLINPEATYSRFDLGQSIESSQPTSLVLV
jgi:hypothetical protein